MEYTKGTRGATFDHGYKVKDGEHSVIAAVMPRGDADRTEANTRLLAAAPDMYEALKAIAPGAKHWNENDPYKKLLFDALAKAEGN